MDEMAIHADEQLAGAVERMEQIEYNSYLADKMKAGNADQTKTEKAEVMIKELETLLNSLSKDIQTVDSAYTNTKARNYIGFSENNVGIADRIGLVFSLLCAILFLLAVFICVFLRTLFSDKEREA